MRQSIIATPLLKKLPILVALLSSSSGLYAQQASAPPLYGVHNLELKEGVTAAEFEAFVREQFAPAWINSPSGLRGIIVKGDRGERKDKYQLIWVFPSAATRDKFFPTEGGQASDEYRAAMAPFANLMRELGRQINRSEFTDYIPVGVYVPPKPGSAPVLGAHSIELDASVDAGAFEKFIVEKFAPAWREPRDGMQIVFLRGDRGARKGKFQLVYVFDSEESRNRYFPEEGGDSSPLMAKTMEPVSEVMQELSQFSIQSNAFTDYQVLTPKARATSVAENTWQDEEWSKLIGVWRAPQPWSPRVSYRIKRIKRGEEILELYDSEGKLLRQSKTDMQIERHRGINFFTVRSGSPQEHKAIYKVYKGKWYEQLPGIFANNKGIRPDAFVIYEKVEDD